MFQFEIMYNIYLVPRRLNTTHEGAAKGLMGRGRRPLCAPPPNRAWVRDKYSIFKLLQLSI